MEPSSLGLKGASSPLFATATTAASGGYREELLGQRPAGCECLPRHDADAGCRNPSGPARRNRRALAALNTRHLLRKPVCGLKAPLGLSCPPGTAVLSGSLLVPKENISGGAAFCKRHKTSNARPRSAREAITSLLPKQCSAVPHRTAKRRGCARPARGSSGGCGPVSRGLPASGR